MSELFKKYLETLVESKDDVVVPEVKNTFGSDIPTPEPPKDSKEQIQNDVTKLIQSMLPNYTGASEKVSTQERKIDTQVENTPVKQQLPVVQPVPSNPFDLLRKQSTDRLPQPEGLKGVEYEVFDPNNIKFMPSLPRFELLHKDHSSIIIAKECLRKYFLSSVVSLVPAENNNIFYPWGTSYHIFRQVLSEVYGFNDKEPKTYDSIKAKDAFKQASRQGIDYWLANGEEQKADSKFDWFTSERLYKSFLKAFEHWSNERKKGQIKVIAVEQYFVVELMDGRFTQGRTDEVVLYQGELWGRDFKTTMKPRHWFIQTLRPNNQIKTYTFGSSKLANKKLRGLILQALYNAKSTKKEDKGPDIFEELVECSDYELMQWEKEQVFWNKILDLCRKEDVWPMTEKNCQYCEYQPVCLKPTEAAMLHTLENKYTLRLRNPAHVD